jgi:hypothetical protein
MALYRGFADHLLRCRTIQYCSARGAGGSPEEDLIIGRVRVSRKRGMSRALRPGDVPRSAVLQSDEDPDNRLPEFGEFVFNDCPHRF